ncbi:ester cyclase [Rhodococcus sp. BP-149]|jgi:steroid delta-isomerase-like uncharacterized protein|uniref:nuclear transport factor 2 family protein n=1 Tax=unclassified Rhodococcus (in: high G+C Gram-positive bacteria) TaxID=192944 RepID=UPI001C9B611F|nr:MULTISPECIES: ester cyclase [unclassified Rhodococcus (in: high G+C Gram-positive bacteria)]MBY6685672.1 ester cyclase [Rhodococcus sp. BP-288]MBY6694780.1 ester cyclase [Rhodococcus sp. BP-188]MBY6696626.1 ester cyclase [Rhodococcus sp. BP-285]MBY6703282.1 ester cyclase [Rhodococcus sp. BP-283]MBY6708605.1 ester cyclase [Rhodococcus sp. BP-241]
MTNGDTILDRVYERWNAHDVEGVLSFFTDDFVYKDQATGMVFHGGQELGDFMRSSFVSTPDLRFDLFNTVETPTIVASEAILRGTFAEDSGPLKATGKQLAIKYGLIGTLVDGRIATLTDYWNLGELTE